MCVGILMFLGCVIYPAGWHHLFVRRICGDDSGDYAIGQCEMRWAFILAIIGFFVILMLAIMAFCLACNQPRRWKNRDVVKRARKPGPFVSTCEVKIDDKQSPSQCSTVVLTLL